MDVPITAADAARINRPNGYTQEPWNYDPDARNFEQPFNLHPQGGRMRMLLDGHDWERARLCVNALARVSDPEAAIAKAREALAEIVNTPHQVYENNEASQYGIGVADGHRCAANMARAALALLTPKESK